MPFATTSDGVRLHYRIAGRARRDTLALVFMHGWCSNLEHWAPVAEALAATHRVVSIDLRGHGRSDAPPGGGYTTARFADDIVEVARGAGIDAAVVVGHSLGAVVAVQAAKRHASFVRALVMVDGPLDRYVPPAELRESAAYRLVFDPPGQGGIAAVYGRFLADPRDAPFLERLIDEASRTPRHVARAAWRGLLATDLPAVARRVRQPVLYVNASSGNMRTAADVRAILPQATFAQAALSGHFAQLEVPDQLCAMMRRFLERLP